MFGETISIAKLRSFDYNRSSRLGKANGALLFRPNDQLDPFTLHPVFTQGIGGGMLGNLPHGERVGVVDLPCRAFCQRCGRGGYLERSG